MLSYRPRRWLVHLALAFGAGVYLGYGVPFSPLWLLTAAAGIALLWVLRRQERSVYLPAMGLAVLAGLLRCGIAAHPALPPEGLYTITAAVNGEASVRDADGRVAVYLKNVRLKEADGSFRAYWTYWPKDSGDPLPQAGQRVRFTTKLYHPSGQVNPHGYDFRLAMMQRGVTIGLSGCSELEMLPADGWDPSALPLRLRQAIRARLDELLGDQGSLASALLLNDKDALDEEVEQGFRLSGTAHVLTVSGLHVMILFSCLLLLIRRFSPSQSTVLLIVLPLLGVYALLVDMRAPVLRACAMILYLQLGRIARRRCDALTGLAMAFAGILLLRPLELFAAGFQMSFCAVLGLIMLGDRVEHALRNMPGVLLRRIVRLYGVTLCATAAVALPVGWYYHRLPLVGLLIGPLVVCAVTLLLPVLIALLLLSLPLMPVARLLGRGVALACAGISRFVQACGNLPWAYVSVRRLPFYAMAAIVLAMALCTRFVRMKKLRRFLVGAGALAAAAVAMLLFQNRAVRYIQFSVGDADAAVIEDGRETVVIDAAERSGDLAAYLRSEGRRADHLILTHLHADHALGLEKLLDQEVPVGEILLPSEALSLPASERCRQALARAEASGIPIRAICAGDRLTTARVSVDVLWPEAGGSTGQAAANDFALGLYIDLDGVTMLHMSDIGGAYEMRCARPAQVLRAAHHGASSSTGERFLAAVSPDIALISARSPSPSVLQRLAQAGVMVYDTNERGALTLTARHGEATLRGFIK